MASLFALIAWGTLYFVSLPIFWLLRVTWIIISVLIASIVHLAHFIAYVCWLPVRFLIALEPLCIYFGVALSVGGILGFLVYTTTNFIATLLGLDEPPEPQGMTIATYRAKRAQKQAQKVEQETEEAEVRRRLESDPVIARLSSSRRKKRSPVRPTGLISTTIFEEEDSSEDDFL